MSAAIHAEDRGLILKSLKADILSAFGDEAGNVTTTTDDEESLVLHYKTRKFIVHNDSMAGEWSEKAHEVLGPSIRGMIVRVVLVPNSAQEGEQWARPVDSRGATIAFLAREPYWDKLVWVMPFDGKDVTARIYFSYGRRVPNGHIYEKLKTLFSKIR